MKFSVSKRCTVTLLGFLGMCNFAFLRDNLSVAITVIVRSSERTVHNSSHNETEPATVSPNETNQIKGYENYQFNWDSRTQGLILGSFYIGYIFTQLPAAVIARKFGAARVFGGGMLMTAVLCLLTPLATKGGIAALISVRCLQGLGQGVMYPTMTSVISKWAPTFERSFISGIIFTGYDIGVLSTMSISGWLSSIELFGGWPSSFYFFGAMSCVWFVFWTAIVYELPEEHPNISREELQLFQTGRQERYLSNNYKVPWKDIFTSGPMWALTASNIGYDFVYYVLESQLPTYLTTVLNFNVKTSGILSGIPFLCKALFGCISCYAADKVRKSEGMSITLIRKIFNSIGLFGPAACILGITVAGNRTTLIVTLFALSMAFLGFTYAGYLITAVDMSPDFSGSIIGFTNGVGASCGVAGPLVVGAFTASGATTQNWNYVFYTTAVICCTTGVLFAIFASGELQPWGLGNKNISRNANISNESNSDVTV